MGLHITQWVRNDQSPRGMKPDTIIMHTTEGHNRPGVDDLRGLATYFDGPVQASSHLGIDQEGNSVRMVPDDRAAWTAGGGRPPGNWNSRGLQIEMIGFAKWSRLFWKRGYREGLNRAAAEVAKWSIKYDIPIRKQAPGGVTGHVNVSGPGGHWDPGPGFPWPVFLLMCKLWKRRLLGRKDLTINQAMRDRIMAALRD